jgi:NAD(P)-dependent dehydrogenase (short-subunit alcohol dehydrogenase family)
LNASGEDIRQESQTPQAGDMTSSIAGAAKVQGLGDADTPWTDIERAILPMFAQVPVGRVGELDEIANAVAFLASSAAGYITGINLGIDGGLSPSL